MMVGSEGGKSISCPFEISSYCRCHLIRDERESEKEAHVIFRRRRDGERTEQGTMTSVLLLPAIPHSLACGVSLITRGENGE